MSEATERTLQLLRSEMVIAWLCDMFSTMTMVARCDGSLLQLTLPAMRFSPQLWRPL
jgi:hypothetical protein